MVALLDLPGLAGSSRAGLNWFWSFRTLCIVDSHSSSSFLRASSSASISSNESSVSLATVEFVAVIEPRGAVTANIVKGCGLLSNFFIWVF